MPTDEGERRARSRQEDLPQESAQEAPVESPEPAPVEAEATGAETNPLREMQERLMARAAGLQRAAESEVKRRQDEADMSDFKRQLRDIDASKTVTRTYTVQPGDTLSAIALAQLGDAGRWPDIFQANGDKISNPNLIYPGQELTIP